MTSLDDDATARILGHLTEITGGRCTITTEQIAACEAGDPRMGEVLTALMYLHEDLVYREQLHTDALARLAEQHEALGRSHAALAAVNEELSTPLIRIGRGVLMAPLIGALDDARARSVLERVLEAVVTERVRCLILDVTGVRRIDDDTVAHFVQIFGAVRLIGSRGVLVGVQPQVAMALADLGEHLHGVAVFASVEAALAHVGNQ